MYIHACMYSIEGGKERKGKGKKKKKRKKKKKKRKKEKKETGDYAQPHHVAAWFSQLVRYPTSGSGPSLTLLGNEINQ